MRARRSTALAAILLTAGTAGVTGARADGLPVLNVEVGPVGVADPTGSPRYVALESGTGTAVLRIAGNRVTRWRRLSGRLTIPAVAYDGTTAGLSADGRTLVLIRPRATFPQRRTRLVVLDATHLEVRRELDLRGDFSFDAVSPHARLIYLVQYLSPGDPSVYAVRAFDMRAGRFLTAPVVDPREPGEEMRGQPVTRATSADGRWAYTLYDGAGKRPFVHALDTVRVTARCIDLDQLAQRRDLGALKLRLDEGGHTLAVRSAKRTLALVDTRTYAASEPVPRGPLAHETPRAAGRVPVWAAVAAGVFVAAAVLLAAVRRRRATTRRTVVVDPVRR